MVDNHERRNLDCSCGSGLPRYGLYDARGIFCCYTCERCEPDKKTQYRPEIFEDSQYDCTEAIEDDY